MTCKSICQRFKADKPSNKETRYGQGQKYCSHCQTWIYCDDVRCPCCKYKIRSNRRIGTQEQRHASLAQIVVRY